MKFVAPVLLVLGGSTLFTLLRGAAIERADTRGNKRSPAVNYQDDSREVQLPQRDVAAIRTAVTMTAHPSEIESSELPAQERAKYLPKRTSSSELTADTGALRISESSEPGADEVQTFYPNGGLMESYKMIDGKIVGTHIHYHPSGSILEQTTYIDGFRSGLSECFAPDGSRLSSGVYVDGNREGVWMEWRSDASPRAEVQYVNGKRVGDCVYYTKDGQIDTEKSGLYKDDRLVHPH